MARLVAGGLAALGLALPALAAQLPFSSANPVGVAQQSSIWADVDRDGDRDVVASGFGTELAWMENTGSGWTSHSIAASGADSYAVAAADVDGDGDTDVLATASGNLSWFGNTSGDGSAWSSAQTIASGVTSHSILPHDVDRDGDLDVVASIDATGVRWYENTGSGWTAHPFGAGNSRGAAVVDLDRDGDLDVVAAFNQGDDRVAWYENTDGAGSFGTQQAIATGLVNATDVVAGDLDGDGDLDVAAGYGPNLKWFENTAGDASAWSAAQTVATLSSPIGGLALADLDADGDLDLVSSTDFSAEVAWHENTAGDASAWSARPVASLGFEATLEAHVADIDGDGDLDIARPFPSLAWYENKSLHRSAPFGAPNTIDSAADLPNWVSAGDLDRDGDQDALIINVGGTGGIRWRENTDGAGSFGPANLVANANHARVIRLADMDRDGDPDLVTAATGSLPGVAWHENTSPGTALAWTTRTISSTYPMPFHADVGDIDTDGDPDVIAGSLATGNSSIAWFENTAGDASAWSQHLIAGTQDYPSDVRLADVDGDGDLDVFYTEVCCATIAWKENTAGDGSAWSDHIIENGLSTTVPHAVEPADVDRDGDVDVVVASRGSNNSAWFENANGSGTSWTRHGLGSSARLFWLRVSDLDLDGDFDVVGAGEEVDSLIVFENQSGDGSVWSSVPIGTQIDQPFGVDAADLDGDGDDDLLAAGFQDEAVVWFENGGGQFALPTMPTAYQGMVESRARQVLAIDFAHRGRSGDSDAELSAIELRLEDSAGIPLTASETDNLFSQIQIRLGSPTGAVIATAGAPFGPSGGVITLPFADADPNVQLDPAQQIQLYVVPTLTANASSAPKNQFQFEHVTESSSRAEDASADLPLSLEYEADTSSGVIQALSPSGDADSDGLTNAAEADTHGTDPGNADTDADGASDGLEVNTLGTNPLAADSDGDGLVDGAEVALTTDPTDPDSDADGFCDGPNSPSPIACTAGDNCPVISNGAQTNSDPLSAGDACQCGNVDGSGGISATDYKRAREHVAGATPSGPFDLDFCDVNGDAACDVADLAILDRLTSGAPAGLLDACAAYTGL